MRSCYEATISKSWITEKKKNEVISKIYLKL